MSHGGAPEEAVARGKPGSVYASRVNYALYAKTFDTSDIPAKALEAKRAVKTSIHKDILERHKPKWDGSTHTEPKHILKHQILKYNSLSRPYNFRAESLPPRQPLQFPLSYSKFQFDERALYAQQRGRSSGRPIAARDGGRDSALAAAAAAAAAAPPPTALPAVDIFLGDYDPSAAAMGPDSPDSMGEAPSLPGGGSRGDGRSSPDSDTEAPLGGRARTAGTGRPESAAQASDGRRAQSRPQWAMTTATMSPRDVLASRVVNTRREIPTAPTLPASAPRWDATTTPDKKKLSSAAAAEIADIRRRAEKRSPRTRRITLVQRTRAFNESLRTQARRQETERQRLRELYGPSYEPESEEDRSRRAARRTFRPRIRHRNKVPRQREYYHQGVLQEFAAGHVLDTRDDDPDSDDDGHGRRAWSCCMGSPASPGCVYRLKPDNRAYRTSIPQSNLW